MGDDIYQTEVLLEPKVGVFSDIHLGLGQDSENWHTIMLEFAAWSAKIFREQDITDVIIPGDIFHNRSEISLKTLDVCHKFFETFKDFRLFISSGNHDCWMKHSSEINSLSILKNRSDIHIIDQQPKVFGIKNSTKKISLIPWGTSIEDIPKTDICFGHFEISSFALNNHKICQHGEDVANLFARSPFIITGHFHKREFRQYKTGEVLYLGSPYQQNFGDVGEQRGIYILDLNTNGFEFIENKISPRHYKISINQMLNGKLKADHLKELVPKNLICLVIDKTVSADHLSLIISKIQNLNPGFFRLDYDTGGINVGENNSENYTAVNVIPSIENFINSLDIQYKAETMEYLIDLYNSIT